MKILLLSAPYLPDYMRNARCDFVSLSATQWYPILLGYCGAYLQGRGHDVKLVDAPAHCLNHETTRQMAIRFRPDLLVLYTGYMSEKNDLDFADTLMMEIGCDAVIVGPFASIDPEGTLGRSGRIHKLIAGEFDHAVGDLAAGRMPESIGNLLYKSDGKIIRNEVRPNITGAQLDEIPFVSEFFMNQVNVRRYKTPSERYPFLDIMTGRGCRWGQCTYCLWVHSFIRGGTYNVRSVANVISELQFIAKKMPYIRSVMFQDDTLTEARATELCDAMLSSGIRLPWSCYARGDLDYKVLALMKHAGCRNLHVGYESADPEILKRIRKGLTVERMTRFTEDARKAGLRIHGDFALGFPGETQTSAQKTIEWACRLKPHTAQFQLMIPFPGTPYHDEMVKNNWLNAAGQPDMPQFGNDEIRAMAKKAYRRFYFSPHYFRQCCLHPYEHVITRMKTIRRAIPAMFWQRWNV